MRLNGSTGIIFTLLIAGPVEFADAQGGSLRSSQWDTVYTTPDGTNIGARLTLDGTRGSYVTREGARGTLRDISYRPVEDRQLVSGTWRFENGQEGNFELFVQSDVLYGLWRERGGARSERAWSGTRVGARGLPWVAVPGISNAGTVQGVTQAVALPGGRMFILTYDQRSRRVLRQQIQRQ